MTRPILWALGVFGSVAAAASTAGERLARATPTREAAAITATPTREGQVTVPADRTEHFVVEAGAHGEALRMVVDTGATSVVLREEDARRMGLALARSDFRVRVRTANGEVEVAPVRLRSLRVGAIELRDVEAVVVPAGKLGTNLLGMSFLKRLRGFDIAGGRLTLRG